jgi:integrase
MGKRSQVRLTARTVLAARLGTIAWDAEVKGFGIRVMGSGARFFVLKYRFGTLQRWFTIGQHGSPWTAEQARARAVELLGLLAKGQDPAAQRDRQKANPTIRTLTACYLAEHVLTALKASSAREYRRVLERFIIPELGNLRTADVTTEHVSRLHRRLKATPRQANIVLQVASKMFELAERWGDRPAGSNPCRHVVRFKEVSRDRFLSEAEIARLGDIFRQCERGWTQVELEAHHQRCVSEILTNGKTLAVASVEARARMPDRLTPEHPSVVPALRLLLLTGARLSEVLTLTWQMVDHDERVLRLPDSKTGKKVIPLAPAALEVIEAQRNNRIDGNPHVFPGAKAGGYLTNLERPWINIRKVAGLTDVRIHDLRHTFASHAVMRGMALPLLGKVLGHASAQTTQRYAHFSADPVRQAAEAAAQPLAELLRSNGSSATIVTLHRTR